ncbi:hypothetical protein [Endozoicomonas sp.]|uniref:hypothetical protein n=1 Tax=Endozoicomonas sp. TaxID=1892382 RepID=UPI003AF57A6F
MNKFTLDHLQLSREIALLIEQGDIHQASKHFDQRREKAEQALAFLKSPQNSQACSSCLIQATIHALVCLTLPEDADSEDRDVQNYLVAAYVIQLAMTLHGENTSCRHAIDGERLH